MVLADLTLTGLSVQYEFHFPVSSGSTGILKIKRPPVEERDKGNTATGETTGEA